MDPIQSVGGAEGSKKLADAVHNEGFPIQRVCIANRRSNDGVDAEAVGFVTGAQTRDVLYRLAGMRRDGVIRELTRWRISAIQPGGPEASREIAGARRFDRLPVEIEPVPRGRMQIGYALVAELPGADAAAA